MIKIDIAKKLNKLQSGKTIKSFLDEYANTILSIKKQTLTEKRDGTLTDNFGLFTQPLNIAMQKHVTLTEVLLHHSKTNTIFKKSIQIINIILLGKSSAPVKNITNKYITIFIKNLLIATPNQLEEIINKVKADPKNFPDKTKDIYKKIFQYDLYRIHFVKYFVDLDFQVCYYCNRNYISNFSKKSQEKSTFTLDHFHQKEKYPMLALSFYNLIPSCYTCNSTIKGKNNVEQYKNNYDDGYDFDTKASFEFESIGNKHLLTLTSTEPKIQQYIKDFKHHEIYQVHINDAIELFKKQRDLEFLIKKYEDITNINEVDIKKTIFGEIIFLNEQDKESLSKLKQDIAKQLKII